MSPPARPRSFSSLTRPGGKPGDRRESGAPATRVTALTCTVADCEFLGSETFIGLSHPAASGLTVSLPGLRHIPAGEKMEIAFSDKDLHFFDAAGQRLADPAGQPAFTDG